MLRYPRLRKLYALSDDELYGYADSGVKPASPRVRKLSVSVPFASGSSLNLYCPHCHRLIPPGFSPLRIGVIIESAFIDLLARAVSCFSPLRIGVIIESLPWRTPLWEPVCFSPLRIGVIIESA